MSFKKDSRQRRARKTRARISDSGKVRLCITRSHKYITAQLIKHGLVDSSSDVVLGCVSSNQAELKKTLKGGTSNKSAAELVGQKIAEVAKKLKISDIAFDRSGYKYHGCIAKLAEAARAGGLKF